MTTDNPGYAYGPVPSRRLGKSLGINTIPAKECSYGCVYCQVGRTLRMTKDRRRYYEPEDIFREVQDRLARARAASERVDYLAFVPDGEPTLDVDLAGEITRLKSLGIPVAVITNASLVWREDVREALGLADWVSLKIDAVREPLWRRVNRPHPALKLPLILDGMLALADNFSGRLVTETMLVGGLNDQENTARETAAFLRRLQPSCAYVSVPTRPPAETAVRAPAAADLDRTCRIFAENVERVEKLTGYEGNAFAHTGNIEQDLLGITAVHPMREEAVAALLERAGASWEDVRRLVQRGELRETVFEGRKYFLRCLRRGGERKTGNER